MLFVLFLGGGQPRATGHALSFPPHLLPLSPSATAQITIQPPPSVPVPTRGALTRVDATPAPTDTPAPPPPPPATTAAPPPPPATTAAPPPPPPSTTTPAATPAPTTPPATTPAPPPPPTPPTTPPPPIPILVTVLRFTGVSVWPFDDAKSAALAVALAKAVAGVGAPRNVAVIGAVALTPPTRRLRKLLQDAPIGADVAVALRAADEAGAAAIGTAPSSSTPALRTALAEGGIAVDAIDILSSTVATASSSLLFSCASGSVGGVCLPSPPSPGLSPGAWVGVALGALGAAAVAVIILMAVLRRARAAAAAAATAAAPAPSAPPMPAAQPAPQADTPTARAAPFWAGLGGGGSPKAGASGAVGVTARAG